MKHQNTAETYFHSAQHNPIHCRHLVVRGREFGSWVIADPLRTGSMGVIEMISDRIAGLQRAVFNTIGWSEVDLNGRHAVVVGGGRGIGYSLVKLLVEAGCIVHVIDVHQKSLTKIETEFQFLKTKSVRTYTVDVADEQSFEDAANKIKVDIAPDFISILVHSVAVVNNCSVDELSPEQLLTIFRVNLFSWFACMRNFLPEMKTRKDGHIVTMSSIVAYGAGSNASDYCATKSALLSVNNCLRLELIRDGLSNAIHTTIVHPYLIRTGLFAGVHLRLSWLVSELLPGDVAGAVFDAIVYRRQSVFIPNYFSFLVPLSTVLPVVIQDCVSRVTGAVDCMRTFRGRNSKRERRR